MTNALISPLAVAPMIDWSYTHFRVLMRLIAPRALLYTDMQTTGAVLNNPKKALGFHGCELPLALQLGGSDQEALVQCAILAEEKGYSEVNLNLGCPSDRVQAGRFGACLMAEPEQVAQSIKAMKAAVRIPVTAKTRIGIDEQDSYDFFSAFAHQLIDAGCDKLVVHARKAWLQGLSPKQNRTIPPLHYDYVYRIKRAFPALPVVINGNINTVEEARVHWQAVDGVMLGRLACNNPYALADFHRFLYPDVAIQSRSAVMENYHRYAVEQFEEGVPLSILLKPVLNLAHGLAGARRFKELLVCAQQKKNPGLVGDAVFLLQAMEKTKQGEWVE
ncbi:tRNA dihydrouridine(20/20a) synthase DusA [Legionella taurinensis]|uniref:tRNA-dihydrouridine(20/20a) synthase n=1 Tax=Legionella taurinensis TaxID=70611 RepID=A0A3A5L2P7_9GAMM|nr:tRNA dihydrouridine(20/20a) synthase DusA [Legionella taurinensis]MDX1838289.1 tRNA dihydrouridine(20/20a) synthase DusA [Legionella taurinensis]PUT39222.1 tRNA dihydrouridine(20/20a) synthase DusA [Legionella taurinensis]PUT40568.1 tRNA dihydrouridine(20/20a) synthase DusA [Legionella taurinensis]PUT43988.1 tRNA dihydrouridine(20/20a) synthase DusA [Legionella taurinensis]PUT46250.1 tRNA dihydrouridine(20/20a) synthase DusA [Legionella taurinensis]